MNKGINPGFRTVVNGDEDTLARQVTQFEGNTQAALEQVALQAWPKLVPTNVKSAAYTAVEEDLIPCAGTFQLMLPVASPQNQGRAIGIELQSGTLTVIPTKGLVQGGVNDILTITGDYIYISDGVGWYRHALGVATVTAGAGLVNSGTTVNPIIDVVAGDTTIVVSPDSIKVGVISSSNVDSSITTDAVLASIRRELEFTRLLMADLLDIEQKTPPPPGI